MPCSTYEAFVSTMRLVVARSQGIPLNDGTNLYAFKDRSGLCISTFADATKQLRCATPFVVGDSRVRAASVQIEETNECPYCDVYAVDVLDDAGAVQYPLRFYPADIAVTRRLVEGAPAPVFGITAFGKDVQVHADREALFAAHRETFTDAFGDTIGLIGPETLHLGSVTGEGDAVSTPDVYMTATVLTAKKKQNGITGVSHVQCLARTSGAVFDVILAGDATRGRAEAGHDPRRDIHAHGCSHLERREGVTIWRRTSAPDNAVRG
jgi:hypothetical protein